MIKTIPHPSRFARHLPPREGLLVANLYLYAKKPLEQNVPKAFNLFYKLTYVKLFLSVCFVVFFKIKDSLTH